MKRKIKPAQDWLRQRLGMGLERWAFRALPQALLDALSRYFRLQVDGTENLPPRGAVLIVANHSGFSGLDALILAHQVQKASGRVPRVLTHHLWFLTKFTSLTMNKLGFLEASLANGLRALAKNQVVIIFPEGESGNFKPSLKAYDLQEFRRGFVRMAVRTGAPIVPALIIGAEETHINLSQLKLSRYFPGLTLPLPLNVVPLPAKWRIRFLPPVSLPYASDAAEDNELMCELAEEIRERMQRTLTEMLAERGSVYW